MNLFGSIDTIRKINNAYGAKTKKETDLFLLKREIAKDFDATIGYEGEILVNGISQQMIVIHKPNDITSRKIISYPYETFNRGDLIDCYGSKWLVTQLDANKQVYTVGKMEQCNREIRWQNKSTFDIIKRWVIAKKPYTSEINTGNVISTSERKFKIQMQYDNETRLLDLGYRFMLEIIDGKPKTYVIISVDQTTDRYDDGSPGFISFIVEQDAAERENDNIELEICDYIEPPTPPVIVPKQIKINTSNNKNEIYLGGSSWKIFDVDVFDEYGNKIIDLSTIIFNWDINANILQLKWLRYEDMGNSKFKIKCEMPIKDNEMDQLLSSKFKLSCNIDNFESDEIEIEIISILR